MRETHRTAVNQIGAFHAPYGDNASTRSRRTARTPRPGEVPHPIEWGARPISGPGGPPSAALPTRDEGALARLDGRPDVAGPLDQDGAGDVDGAVGAAQEADDQAEREPGQPLAAEEEEDDHHQPGRQRR